MTDYVSINLNKEILNNFKLLNKEYLVGDLKFYVSPPGENEYYLYSYLTTFFDNIVILDIGTGSGYSTISLSHNEKTE